MTAELKETMRDELKADKSAARMAVAKVEPMVA